MDANGVANIAYTRAGEAVRVQVDGDDRTVQILARDDATHSAIGLDLDLNGLAQVATTSFDAGQTELSIFKSLKINQRVDFPMKRCMPSNFIPTSSRVLQHMGP